MREYLAQLMVSYALRFAEFTEIIQRFYAKYASICQP